MKIQKLAGQVLEDARCYLQQIESMKYQQKLSLLSNTSIGQHSRHFIEFYQCLLNQATSANCTIDYAKRQRNYAIESDPVYAMACIDKIQDQLQHLNAQQSCSLESSEHCAAGECLTVASTIERELIFNIEHTIHHLAIIKIALKHDAPEVKLPNNFGIAPSTIQHQIVCVQ